MSCPLKCDSHQEDSQIHLMSCSSILSRIDSKYIQETKNIKYSDIYGEPHSQKTAVRCLSALLDVRKTILEELPSTTSSTSGPTLDTAIQGSSGGQSLVVFICELHHQYWGDDPLNICLPKESSFHSKPICRVSLILNMEKESEN